jgi:hypothetical protein
VDSEATEPSPTEGSEQPSGEPSPSADLTSVPTNPPAGATGPPVVADLTRTDFSAGGGLPAGARTFDNGAVGQGMAVRDGQLQHGRPQGPAAMSSLELQLPADVRKLGARFRFLAEGPDSGGLALVAWQDSLVQALRSGSTPPASGLRLLVNPGAWTLIAVPDSDVLARGTFTSVPGTATIEVYRDQDRAWVVDPSGTVTTVTDPRIAELAGPWASWQLYERVPSETPAVIESVWAG